MDLVLVVGCESNGTRLLTRLLLNLGYWGVDGHVQPSVSDVPKGAKKAVVRRSVPHGGSWTEFLDEYNKAEACRVFVPIRNPHFAALSAVEAKHVATYKKAFKQQVEGLQRIFEAIPTTDLYPITYESLFSNTTNALSHLGIPYISEKIINANEKYT